MTEGNDKVRENRLRRAAARQGCKLQKSPRRDPRALDYGRYWLLDDRARRLIGGDWGTDLDVIEEWLNIPCEGRVSA